MSLPIDDINVEIAPGADPADPSTWDAHYVSLCEPEPGYPDGRVQRPVTINTGRQSEGSEAPPTSCSFEVRNEDGALSPDNPEGPWFGLLGKGTPLRVTWGASVRFEGHISELPTTWLNRVQNSRVQIRADGITRRLMQGAQALESPLFRATVNRDDVVAYWPLEEPSGATQGSSPIRGVNPMQPKGDLEFGQGDNVPAGSQPGLLAIRPGATNIMGRVPAVTASQWLVSELFRVNEVIGTGFWTAMQVESTGSVVSWRVQFSDTQIRLLGLDSDEVAVVTSTQSINFNEFFGQWLFISLSLAQSGTAVNWAWSVRAATPQLTNVNGTSGSLATSTVGRVTQAGPFPGPAGGLPERFAGHVTVLRGTGSAPVFDTSAIYGHGGERAGERFERLCQEENLHCTVVGDVADTMPMGPQRTTALLDQFRDVEQTDGGILTDLTYRTRASLYNQSPVSIDFCDLNGAPESTHDDRFTRNDVTASRSDGSSARQVNEAHVARHGRYDDSATVNTESDDWLPQVASWLVHLGTSEASRWPTVPVSINAETLHVKDTVLGLRPGDRLQIPHDVPQFPGVEVDLLVEGWSETIFSRRAEFVFNCTPAAPWSSLFTVDDDTLGRLESDAYLAEDIDDDDTTFDVVVPVRRLNPRTSFAENTPFITSLATTGGEWFISGGTLVRSSEQLWRGRPTGKFTPTAASPTRLQARSALMVQGATYRAEAWLFSPTGGFNVILGVEFYREPAWAGVAVNAFGDQGYYTSAFTMPAGQWVRATVTGAAPAFDQNTLSRSQRPQFVSVGVFYNTGGTTPANVLFVGDAAVGVDGQPFTTDSGDLPMAVRVGGEVMSVSAVGAMTATGLQQLTVTRAANGLAKAHPAGTDVDLYPSPVLSL